MYVSKYQNQSDIQHITCIFDLQLSFNVVAIFARHNCNKTISQ